MEAPLALYRRYRPETFAEVIGQDHVTAPLRNALSNNRVNHAYLFSGPRGCGKTTSARILARAINCEKGPIAEPCGVCKSCTDLARGGPGSIDVIEIDAASHGGVDDARDLRERAFFAPVESRYKIYIIDEAHMVTTQGFNALLKLVEEPPPHLKFIFATTEPDKVIGTIRSRTHHYPFRLVPPKVLADYMASLCQSEGVEIEPAALPLVVRAGAGSVRDSLSVLDQLIGGAGPEGVTYELAVALLGFTPDSLLDACVDGFAAHDSAAVFETIEKVIETGQDPKRFAEDLLRRLRDLVVLSAVPTAITSGLIEAAEDQGERLQMQAAGIGSAELTRAADIVAAGLLEMRGATAPRLQLELICAKVLLPGADDSTNGIQARLDRMERRLAIGVPVGTPDAAPAPVSSPAAGRPGAAPASLSGGPADETVGGPAPEAASSRAAARAAAGSPATRSTPPAGQPGAAAGGTGGAFDGTGGTTAPGTDSGFGDAAGSASGGYADAAAPDGDPGSVGAGAGREGSEAGGGAAPGTAGADAGRTGGWGSEPAGAGSGQAAEASGATGSEAQASAVSPEPRAGGASVGLADIRRLWPEVLEAVKTKRRFAWIMLSQNAQVIAIDDQTLTLGLVNAGARESFARSGSDEILRQAMIDTIGLNRRVEAVVDPSTDPGAGGPHSGGGPRSGGPRSGGPGSGSAGGPAGGAGAPGAGGPGANGPGAGGPGANGQGAGGPGAGGPGSSGSGASRPGASGPGGDNGPAISGPGASGATGVGPAGRAGAGGGAAAKGGVAGAAGGEGTASPGSGVSAATGARGTSAGGPSGPGTGGAIADDRADGPHGFGSAASGAGVAGGAAGAAGMTGMAAGAPSVAGSAGAGGTAGVAGSAGGVGAAGSAGGAGVAGDSAAGGAAAARAAVGAEGASSRSGSWSAGEVGDSGRGGSGAGQWPDGPGAALAVEEPPDPEYDVPPEPDPWDEGPAPAVSKRRAAEAAVAAEKACRAAKTPVRPAVPLTPEEEAAEIGDDDIVLDEDSQSHTDLLRETLGAQIITEEPN